MQIVQLRLCQCVFFLLPIYIAACDLGTASLEASSQCALAIPLELCCNVALQFAERREQQEVAGTSCH